MICTPQCTLPRGAAALGGEGTYRYLSTRVTAPRYAALCGVCVTAADVPWITIEAYIFTYQIMKYGGEREGEGEEGRNEEKNCHFGHFGGKAGMLVRLLRV